MVTAKMIAKGIVRATAIMLMVLVGLYLIYQIRVVIIYLVLAIILTLIGNPFLDFFKRRLKFKNTFATILTLLIFILIFSGNFDSFI